MSPPLTTEIKLEKALLPDGWHDNVVITVNQCGDISHIQADLPGAGRGVVPGHTVPGMVNLHSHAHQRAMAGLAERSGDTHDSFWTWREVMYHYVSKITPDNLEAIAAQLYIEMLLSGYTSVAEFQYLHHDPAGNRYSNLAEMSLRTLRASRDAGIGMTNLPVLYRYGGFGSAPPTEAQRRFVNTAEAFLDLLGELRAASDDDLNVTTGLAPHSARAIDAALLHSVLEADSGFASAPVHVHVAEQRKEVDDCMAWCARRPVEWFLDEFDVTARWCLVHATHMTPTEVARLAASGAVAGLCPTTEANLGDGLFEAVDYLAAGGVFGIGSDSHVSISPVEELRWLEYGQRLKVRGRNVLAGGPGRSTGRRLYDGALAGGARASGRKLGKIEVGARADLVVIDGDTEVTYGREGDALLDTWLFAGNRNVVKHVYVGGKQVVQDGRHARAEAIAGRFKDALDELAA